MDENHNKNKEAGWFEKFKGRREVGSAMTEFQAKFDALN
jgi:hypothetical protein